MTTQGTRPRRGDERRRDRLPDRRARHAPIKSSHLILGFDGSSAATTAARFAQHLARLVDADLTVATAFADANRQTPPASAFDRRTVLTAERDLEAAVNLIGDDVVGATVALGNVTAQEGLHELAAKSDAHAIVIGAPLNPAPWSHGAPCAVAVVPASAPVGPIRRIAVAFDGSPSSVNALHYAQRLADFEDDTIRQVNVVHVDTGLSRIDFRDVPPGQLLHSVDHAFFGTAHLRLVCQSGDPGSRLAAATRCMDLLVMGSRAQGPLNRMVLGRVSDHVARHAACPVIVVPDPVQIDPPVLNGSKVGAA